MQAQILKDKHRREQIGFFLGILAVVLFAGTLPFTHIALRDFSPSFITFGRAALATVCAIVTMVILTGEIPA